MGSGTDRDTLNNYDRFPPQLSFTDEQRDYGSEQLANFGLPSGSRFALLNVRDDSYLAAEFPGHDWGYHSYRNATISNYQSVAEYLTRQGLFVFRMGAHPTSRLETENPMVFDYANNGMRSDFMDIFLGAHCEFCISTASGFDAVPTIFRRPVLYVDVAPIGYIMSWASCDLVQAKKLVDIETGRALTLRETFDRGLGFATASQDYVAAGVRLSEAEPDEITSAAREMVCRLNGSWTETPEASQLQARFWEAFNRGLMSVDRRDEHGAFHARYVTNALQASPAWLD
jgi:putative glycosyltransferase (TIGR04372 family)